MPVSRSILVGCIALLLALAATSCINPGVGIGAHLGINLPGHGSAQGSVLVGTKSGSTLKHFTALAGHAVTVSYHITVEQGSVSIIVANNFATPGQDLFYRNIAQTSSDQVKIPITQTGQYTIWIGETGFAGNYDVSWSLG